MDGSKCVQVFHFIARLFLMYIMDTAWNLYPAHVYWLIGLSSCLRGSCVIPWFHHITLQHYPPYCYFCGKCSDKKPQIHRMLWFSGNINSQVIQLGLQRSYEIFKHCKSEKEMSSIQFTSISFCGWSLQENPFAKHWRKRKKAQKHYISR